MLRVYDHKQVFETSRNPQMISIKRLGETYYSPDTYMRLGLTSMERPSTRSLSRSLSTHVLSMGSWYNSVDNTKAG